MSKVTLLHEKAPGFGSPVAAPQDCYDWLGRDEVARLAHEALDLAIKACSPPAGERFVMAGQPYASRRDVADNLAFVFGLLVKADAYAKGIGRDEFRGEAARARLWRRQERSRRVRRAWGAAGGQPPASTTQPGASTWFPGVAS